MSAHTPGPWSFACDSYGRVQHSRKACVYSVVKGLSGDRIVSVAARIENWADAKVIAESPAMLQLLREAFELLNDDDTKLDRRDWSRSVRELLQRVGGK